MEVSLTSAVFLHPETASRYSFNSLQLLLMVRRPLSKENKSNDGKDNLRMRGSRMEKEANNGNSIDKQEHSQAVVRLLISESVAKGHVMLSQPLRFYLRAGLHSCRFFFQWWVNIFYSYYVEQPSFCHFRLLYFSGLINFERDNISWLAFLSFAMINRSINLLIFCCVMIFSWLLHGYRHSKLYLL